MADQKRRAKPNRISKPHSAPAANLSQQMSQKRQEIAKRRVQVAALYHARKTQEEIADALGVDQAQISRDLATLREQWKQQAVAEVAEIKADELAFYFDQRASVIAQWQTTHDPRYMQLIVKWSERIAASYGIDAPQKHEVKGWQDEVIELLRAGKVTSEDIESELGDDAHAILVAAGAGRTTPAPTEEKGGASESPAAPLSGQ